MVIHDLRVFCLYHSDSEHLHFMIASDAGLCMFESSKGRNVHRIDDYGISVFVGNDIRGKRP